LAIYQALNQSLPYTEVAFQMGLQLLYTVIKAEV